MVSSTVASWTFAKRPGSFKASVVTCQRLLVGELETQSAKPGGVIWSSRPFRPRHGAPPDAVLPQEGTPAHGAHCDDKIRECVLAAPGKSAPAISLTIRLSCKCCC